MQDSERSGSKEESVTIYTGVLVEDEGYGYYIQPDIDDLKVVGFPGLKPNEIPDGLNVGDRIEFTLDPDRSGNASKYSKIEPEEGALQE